MVLCKSRNCNFSLTKTLYFKLGNKKTSPSVFQWNILGRCSVFVRFQHFSIWSFISWLYFLHVLNCVVEIIDMLESLCMFRPSMTFLAYSGQYPHYKWSQGSKCTLAPQVKQLYNCLYNRKYFRGIAVEPVPYSERNCFQIKLILVHLPVVNYLKRRTAPLHSFLILLLGSGVMYSLAVCPAFAHHDCTNLYCSVGTDEVQLLWNLLQIFSWKMLQGWDYHLYSVSTLMNVLLVEHSVLHNKYHLLHLRWGNRACSNE